MFGTVRLQQGTELPTYDPSDLERHPRDRPAAVARPPDCHDADQLGQRPVRLGANRGLAGVVVAGSGFTTFAEREPVRHRVRLEDCVLTPTMVSATDGDKLIVENAMPHEYQPVFGVRVEAETLKPGETVMYPLIGGGIESVMCTAQARCGRADVVIFHHTVHAVSGPGGEFQIDDFPTGLPVQVHAWHPLFEESSTTVWLEPGERRRVDLMLQPR